MHDHNTQLGSWLKLGVLVVVCLIPLFTIPVFGQEKIFPDWFRNNASWWGQSVITDQEFVPSIEYLIDLGIVDFTVTGPATNTDFDFEKAPWVKNNADWWSNGQIKDSDFASGIQFMISNGIIGTSSQKPTDLSKSFSIEKLPTEDGLKVTWTIKDSKKHAIASGNIFEGLDGKFQSDLLFNIVPTFFFFFTEEGTFEYFDLVQPWASGTITVVSSDLEIYQIALEQKIIEEELVAAEKEKDLQLLEEITEIRKRYGVEMRGMLSAPLGAKNLQDYIGEEKYERYQEVFSDFDTRMISGDYSFFDRSDYTVEEKFLVVEVFEDTVQFVKKTIKERLAKIEPFLAQVEAEINETKISDEEKSRHISELRSATEEIKAGFVKGMSNSIQTLEQEIKQKKTRLEIEAELLGIETEPDPSICGLGTEMKNGQCVPTSVLGGGCLIATATFGSELAPQVQMLREIRDNSLLQTQSGQSFMKSFNSFYYSFSPTIADYERQNPVFKEAVKVTITPLLASLSLLNYVDMDSEESVLGYGIGIILMNVGMYFVAPVIVISKLKK